MHEYSGERKKRNIISKIEDICVLKKLYAFDCKLYYLAKRNHSLIGSGL